MELIRGIVVQSAAGRDKGGFFVVLQAQDGYALLCDGKHRPLQRPKKKKEKHLRLTKVRLPEASMQTNREIRRALHGYQAQQAAQCSA